ncbi:MAG TPA: recombinase family protein, partial [Polyangiaceae bacterium]
MDFTGKRVAIYARFSSQHQREASLEDQVRQCRSHVESGGGTVSNDLVFEDAGISGASLRRPAFERMMSFVDSKRIDVIVTEDVSRVSRDFADAASVFRQLEYVGVPLIGVADGIDTSAGHAKMSFTMKSLMSDMYLDDLRYKTLRGLEGRALAGFSTGGLPIGYRSEAVKDGYDRNFGFRILKDDAGAAVVQRVFALYLDGMSLSAIARFFNAEGVPSPRARTRHRRKGWVASTIRAMLHNEAYVGEWSFKKLNWRKMPGTNVRRYRPRPEAEIIRRTYEDRRIIDAKTWKAVQERLAAVHRCYTKTEDGKPKGRASGKQNNYVLSGLLMCGSCGAP